MTWRSAFAVSVVVLVFVSVLSGHYIYMFMNRANELEAEVRDWIHRYSQLSVDYQELSERYNTLNKQYDKLRAEHTDLQSRYERLSENYNTLKSQYEDLFSRYNKLEADYKHLANQYNALLQEYQSLSSRHAALLQEFSELRENYTALQSRYDVLALQYNELLKSYNELKSSYESLQTSYAQLQSQYQSLMSDYNNLVNRYRSLNSSYASLLDAYGSLKSSYEQLLSRYNDLASKYTALYNDYTVLLNKYNYFISWYNNIKNQVNVRIKPYLSNMTKFVTPDDPTVVSLMLSVTGGWSNPSDMGEAWSDMYKLYKWVVDNIMYSYDSPEPLLPDIGGSVIWRDELWRYPNETIRAGTGDCEDMANLLASLILAHNGKKYGVWVMLIDFGDSGHAAVVIPVKGGKIAILDPAGRYYTSTWYGSLTSRDATEELQKYFQHWGLSGRVYAVYSYNMYKTFNSNEEFIQYVRNVTSA